MAFYVGFTKKGTGPIVEQFSCDYQIRQDVSWFAAHIFAVGEKSAGVGLAIF